MNAREYCIEIEQLLRSQSTGAIVPDRLILLDWLSSELNELTGKYNFDWANVVLDPAIKTSTGVNNYPLPENFGDNFARYAGENGEFWCCLLSDGSNEVPLEFTPMPKFFSQNRTAMANSRPTRYTIYHHGIRKFGLSPPPDANGTTGYTIGGVYPPTDWKIEENVTVPPVPGNSPILKYAVLRRIIPDYETKYQEALAFLLAKESMKRRGRIVPRLGRMGGRNDYKVMRRR